MPVRSEVETVVGLEVHVQLSTGSKLFCPCSTRFADAPNTNVCPTCLGLPGSLPTLNRAAVELGARLALALGCSVRERSVFARKSYFYPDLPKGYQITQHDEPLATGGRFEVRHRDGSVVTANISRVHLEEDAGRSLHDRSPDSTLLDYNRSGIPLAEIVTAPDFRTAEAAAAWLDGLRRLVRQIGVSDGNMEEGSLRCDCNVSIRRAGSGELGGRVEVKNLGSFRSVARAIEHEAARQVAVLADGGEVERSTRLWDEASKETRLMRLKEGEDDYRYLPDPDVPPLEISGALRDGIAAALPELPEARRRRFVDQLGLQDTDALVLTCSRALADYFEAVAENCGDPREAARWVQGEVLRDLRERGGDTEAEATPFPLAASRLADLIRLVGRGEVSVSAARRVFAAMTGTDQEAADLVAGLGLRQESDEPALRDVIRRVVELLPQAVVEYRGGNPKAVGFLMGRLMKETGGRANPALARRLLLEELEHP